MVRSFDHQSEYSGVSELPNSCLVQQRRVGEGKRCVELDLSKKQAEYGPSMVPSFSSFFKRNQNPGFLLHANSNVLNITYLLTVLKIMLKSHCKSQKVTCAGQIATTQTFYRR